MLSFLDGSGFLSANSSAGADISLIVMLAAFALLTIGVMLARSERYEAHRWVQTTAVCVNALPVVLWMIRSFWLYVRPDLPGNLSTGVNALTTIHAVVGIIGVVIGLFIVVRGNQLMASGESLSRYKDPMRVAYAVYLLGTALGVWVYIAIYG